METQFYFVLYAKTQLFEKKKKKNFEEQEKKNKKHLSSSDFLVLVTVLVKSQF